VVYFTFLNIASSLCLSSYLRLRVVSLLDLSARSKGGEKGIILILLDFILSEISTSFVLAAI
jgi:hypothetical protein